MRRIFLFALLVVLAGCTKTKGPKHLSEPVWLLGRRAVPAFQRASAWKDGASGQFDPRMDEASQLGGQLESTSCGCSNKDVIGADDQFKKDVRDCLSILHTYREGVADMEKAITKVEADAADTKKQSAGAVLAGCDVNLASYLRD